MTTISDLVLIYLNDTPLSFARIEDIEPDHKPNWYHVTLLLLQVPLQVVTWILRDVYIDGETFTMDGNPMRLEKVESPAIADTDETEDSDEQALAPEAEASEKPGKVISLADLKKK